MFCAECCVCMSVCLGNKQVAAAIAFSLALFSHALNHAMMRLQTALYELENPPRKFTSSTPGITGTLLHLMHIYLYVFQKERKVTVLVICMYFCLGILHHKTNVL